MITLRSEPPEGVRIIVDEDDLTGLEGVIQGPPGTPYEGGYFRVKFAFGPEYPNLPPKCTMITKIFHPNISKSGEICVDTLKKGWNKSYGVGHVLVTIKCLLIYPNPESALDEEAGKQLLADYEGYSKYAKLMTSIHATPKTIPAELRNTTTSSNTMSSGTTKPTPLGAIVTQEQSPSLDSPAIMGDIQKVLKPVTTNKPRTGTAGGETSKTSAASKAKRGAKRL
ncbi:ubiquitin-conjugating enzyme E2 S [Kwoniella heveanensis BCC8398]|uniref:E2 ubiquitin-conjugating enzyme n=1 Tax=Kwoniella heveanensis BCC8398 TaxID=1296120 RepID=A0A1B9H1P3_9TREE|nr:ubiquitin-conjugating enzyme E2 S [Kwoniella heveanensis BCC8398]